MSPPAPANPTRTSPDGIEPAGGQSWPVWGHDAAVEAVQRDIRSGHLAHAYLIAGPAGIGKSAFALAFAQTICCTDDTRPERDHPCGACLSCQKVLRGVHPDVQTFSLEQQAAEASSSARGKNTSMTIETARAIRAATVLRPIEAPWRVLIVDDAELLQETAQEALLKTLEEPPASVILLLLAADADLLLPTIRSRCRALELRPVARGIVERALIESGLEALTAAEIADLAAGRMGWARRAAGDRSLIDGRRAAVDRALDWIAGSPYDRIVAAMRLGDGFSKRRDEVFDELDSLLGVWRDALLLHADQPSYLTNRGIAERLDDLTRGWDLAALSRAIQAVRACIADLEANVRPRLAMEAMVLEWPTSSDRP